MRRYVLLLVAAAVPLTEASSKCKPEDYKWPSDFFYGCGTSAYQIEGAWNGGGRGTSIWDTISHNTTVVVGGDTGDVADDHYHRFEEDVDFFAEELGVETYSFSISWPRILPNGRGPVNEPGVQFYVKLLQALKKRNVTPICKLFHWDLPQALQTEYGGWTSKRVIADFDHYASIVLDRLGSMCDMWITLNEPSMICSKVLEYTLGREPKEEKLLCGHHALLAHAAAVKTFRAKGFKNKKISLINDGPFQLPLDATSAVDRNAARKAMEYSIGWFAAPIWLGDYPEVMRRELGDLLPAFTAQELNDLKGSADFLAFDAYTSQWASALLDPDSCSVTRTESPAWPSCVNSTQTRIDQRTGDTVPIGIPTQSDWNYLVPSGFRVGLRFLNDMYSPPAIVISENGMGVIGEARKDLRDALRDTARINWYQETLRELRSAIHDDNIPVVGFLAWSCLDNFEWEMGYGVRFGIAHVNYDTQKRTAKDSAFFLRSTFTRKETGLFIET
ncbi:hypothetical protein HDU87_008479 [Geranomyces variabilis]|uniref:Beta-glucosidase n=1 Tax=Geranomyces variabilis TaxID=109894 RepID=A0AAD5TNQ1_9FUNG|nr:hypothetical protein HDU87_008479 [Geranomyces variabilis]